MLIAIGIGLVLILTVATGYFVAQEFAYVAVDRSRLRTLAEQGDDAARRALRVTDRLSFVLSGAQLGITITAILVGYVAEPFLGEGLHALLEQQLPEAVSMTVSVLLALFLATTVQMVLGELAPKNWAIATPEHLARSLSRSTLLYMQFAGPVIKVFDGAATRLLRSLGIEPVQELAATATPADLQHIISESGDRGLLDAETSALLRRGLDFHDIPVRHAMIPRIDVVTVRAEDPATRLVELLDTGHTRFPVMGATPDDLRGIISVADLIDVDAADRSDRTVGSLATDPFILPESISLPAALEQMRLQHHQFACITDEHGAFSGVLTLEDIAEELVGDIRDEDDPPEPTAELEEDGSWIIPARWRLDQVLEATGVSLPESDDFDTLSGLVLNELGRLPQVGDTVTVAQTPPPTLSDEPQRDATLEVIAVEHGVAASIRMRSIETGTERG